MANAVGTYELTDSVKNYDLIKILFMMYNTTNKNQDILSIDTDDIYLTDGNNSFIKTMNTGGTSSRYIGINFTNGFDKITINQMNNITGSNVAITKIIGVKGLSSYDYSQMSDTQITQLKTILGIV